MLEFPKSTQFNKRIPKQKFYDNLGTSLERQFIKEIDAVYWRNKLSPETLNISKGSKVAEIDLIEIILKEKEINKNLIEAIDRKIPYHLVFVLKYKEMGQICVSYKEESKSSEGKFKVVGYYKTEWMRYEDLTLRIEGLNLDKVYENFILQTADGKLQVENGENIKDAVKKAKEIEQLEADFKSLETRIRNEKQYNLQVKLAGKLKKVKAELENYRKQMED